MSSDALWPPALDALTAAPAHHRLLLDHASVRVLDTRIAPRRTHAGPPASMGGVAHYVVSWSDFVRRDAQGHVLVDTRTIGLRIEPGWSFWGEALPAHSLENVGSEVLHIISTELKSAD
jgi:hypothetical protein